jgi:glycine dehydrogenase subunit 1
MGSFAPHTEDEISAMLADLGLSSLEELFQSIPESVRLGRPLSVPPGLSEFEVADAMNAYASRNRVARRDLVVFAGGGAYDHDISAVVSALAGQSAFVTAYTPYQPEVSQGVLQALFEFQTMIARLFGVDAANASLYDGGASAVEAVNLAVGSTSRSKVFVSKGVSPRFREMLKTFAAGKDVELTELGLNDQLETVWDQEPEPAAAVMVGYPNYYGSIEDLVKAREFANQCQALLVVVADGLALGIVESPGAFGADVVVGEGQSLGLPLSFGGPYLGLFGVNKAHLRLLPGRIVGSTVDLDGKRGFVTTLRTREQDIRRERATSNVCTNQTLMAIMAAVSLSWWGERGFSELARANFDASHYLADQLRKAGFQIYNRRFVREFVLKTADEPDLVIDRLLDHGYLAGVPLAEDFHGILITATEARSKEQIEDFVQLMAKEVRS